MSSTKTIYDVPNSGWTSSQWNWGYAVGTGHDCAAICRQKYQSKESRASLVRDLLEADRQPENFEEVKLIMALAWQRGRWDGSDGGRGGYGDVLAAMADARRYETENEDEGSVLLVKDMAARFKLLSPEPEKLDMMDKVNQELAKDTDAARRKCSGLVLEAMGFVDNGL